MEQSTVLVLVGIAGNLALIILLVLAWRLLMNSGQPPTVESGSISNRELDELLADSATPRVEEGDQLAGLFRFDSWTASNGNGLTSNGRSSAVDG